jgi:hypothetical protein
MYTMENHNKTQTGIEKLSILLPHWLNHNNDHIRDQEKWIKQAEKAGLIDVADELRKVIDHSIKASHHLAQADLCLKNKILPQEAVMGVRKVDSHKG